jgi:hypothetical protein
MKEVSFSDIAIVSCGTLSLELNHLRKEGFLDTEHLFFTTPGLHEDIRELESQLIDRIKKAKKKSDKVLVVYGGKFCYVNADKPLRTMSTIIEEHGKGVARIEATHCMDMIANEEERERIAQEMAGGDKVWWMVPGWIKFRHRAGSNFVTRSSRDGIKALLMKISPGIREERLCLMALGMLINIWQRSRKNSSNIPIGWGFLSRVIQLHWIVSNPSFRIRQTHYI